jgi:hypothetical protein
VGEVYAVLCGKTAHDGRENRSAGSIEHSGGRDRSSAGNGGRAGRRLIGGLLFSLGCHLDDDLGLWRRLFGGRFGGWWLLDRSRSSSGTAAYDDKRRADRDGRSFGNQNLLDHTGSRRRHLGINLVSRNLEQHLILSDRVPDGFRPRENRALGHRLPKLGHRDGHCHI